VATTATNENEGRNILLFSRWLQYSAVAARMRLISRKATTEMATF
jgi:hypothetical protein